MRPTKKPLALRRETIRQLTRGELTDVHAAYQVRTSACPTAICPTALCPTQQHSCFDSCYDTQCCLEVP